MLVFENFVFECIDFTCFTELSDKLPESGASALLTNVSKDTVHIIEHSTYAHDKLTDLEDKFNNKSQALQALKLSQKHDPKVGGKSTGTKVKVGLKSSRKLFHKVGVEQCNSQGQMITR